MKKGTLENLVASNNFLAFGGFYLNEQENSEDLFDRSSFNDNTRQGLNLDETLDKFLAEYKEFIESVKLDIINADEIVKDYPARKARYTIALERLKTILSEKKLEQKKLYFELYLRFKKESIEKGFKATEEYLKALIHTSPEYISFSKEIIELEKKVNILTACKEALDDLGRMLYLIYGVKNSNINY